MTLEPSQPTFFDGMELPLMSSRAVSRARTLALLESSAAWVKEPAAASGPRSSDLLASYDRNTSSWRTSQHCLLAQANGEADGLAEFSETWPSAGMMRNGKTFRRQPWALPIAESASGLLPTPVKFDGHRFGKISKKDAIRRMTLGHPYCWGHELSLFQDERVIFPNPEFSSVMMGFPTDWTDLSQTATA